MKEDVRPGYKMTEVGVIPEEWEVSHLGNELREPIRNGYSPICPSLETGVWMLSLSSVSSNGFDASGIKPAPVDDQKIYKFLLEDHDIVISRSNTPDRVGLAGIYRGEPAPCSYPDLLMRVRVGNSLDPDYLLFCLLSFSGRKFFSENARGSSSSMVKIDRTILESFPIPLPPTIAEQTAIATALSDVDALIESLEQLLAKKRNIKQGAMQELLTGKRRLPGFRGEWRIIRLGDIAYIKTGSSNNQDKVENGNYPFFVRSSTVERINRYSYDCEAILVPGEGGIGSIFHYINGRFDVHQRVYAITRLSSDVSGKFVFFYMVMNFGKYALENSVKATVDSLRLPTFQNFEILLPPGAEEQEAITTILSDMDAEIVHLDSRLSKARQLKQAMMQELLTGRIRLV